jgi:hypothetical protein
VYKSFAFYRQTISSATRRGKQDEHISQEPFLKQSEGKKKKKEEGGWAKKLVVSSKQC